MATDLENLLGEIAGLRQALYGQQHHLKNRGPTRDAALPLINSVDPAFSNTGYHGNSNVMPQSNLQLPPTTNMNYMPQPLPYTHQQSILPPTQIQGTPGPIFQPSVSFAPLDQSQVPTMQPHMQGSAPVQPTIVPATLSGVSSQSNTIHMEGVAGEQTIFQPQVQHGHASQGEHPGRMLGSTLYKGRRGKLRHVEGQVEGLFCNVPEHHDLEDEIDKLHKQLDNLKRFTLKDKHVELDALDLAVSRQQVMLKRLRQDDKDLRYQKEAKLRELRDLDQAVNERKSRRYM
nr:uncharacterized protein LOC129278128 [Lytechinus pictus]